MLPSRGLRQQSQLLDLSRRRFANSSFRPFSSFHRQHDLLKIPQRSILSSRLSMKPHLSSKLLLVSSASAIRFQSTSPLKSDASAAPSTPPTPTGAEVSPEAGTSFDPNVFDLSNTNLLDMPEQIGYLKSLGLDFGWGPTSMMEWLLEHIHIYCGTPWWGSIILTAIVVRIILFRAYVGAADNAARLAAVGPISKPLTERMKQLQAQGDTAAMMQVRKEIQQIHRRAGIRLSRSFIPMLQVFTGYGTFVLIRAMAKLPVPGLEDGGLLWFQNLAIPDPYLLFPLATAGVLHLAIRRGSDTGVNTMSPAVTRTLSYVFPAVSLLFTWWLPAGLQLSFFFTSLFTIAQNYLFRHKATRQWLGIYPIPETTPDPFAATPDPSLPNKRVVVVPRENYSSSSASSGSSSAKRTSSSSSVNYEAPREASSNVFTRMTKSVTESVSKAQKATIDKIKSLDTPQQGRKRTKAELRAAEKYEEQRQREEAEKRLRGRNTKMR